jgi:hypothetical protein
MFVFTNDSICKLTICGDVSRNLFILEKILNRNIIIISVDTNNFQLKLHRLSLNNSVFRFR